MGPGFLRLMNNLLIYYDSHFIRFLDFHKAHFLKMTLKVIPNEKLEEF